MSIIGILLIITSFIQLVLVIRKQKQLSIIGTVNAYIENGDITGVEEYLATELLKLPEHIQTICTDMVKRAKKK